LNEGILQGDQTICEKIAQNVAQYILGGKWMHKYYCGKKQPNN
jgi:hypothetical protein